MVNENLCQTKSMDSDVPDTWSNKCLTDTGTRFHCLWDYWKVKNYWKSIVQTLTYSQSSSSRQHCAFWGLCIWHWKDLHNVRVFLFCWLFSDFSFVCFLITFFLFKRCILYKQIHCLEKRMQF